MFIVEFALEFVEFAWIYVSAIFWNIVHFILQNRPRKDIKNAHILITGAASGLGKEMVNQLANSGNTLHLVDINTKLNDKNKEDFADRDCTIHTYYCDVSKIDSILQMHKEVMDKCPHVDYLINNAGIIIGKLFQETSIQEMDLVMQVNCMGVMHVTKVFLDGMIEHGGHIVFVSSVAGQIGAPFMTDYCTSKHAVTGFSRTLVYDLEYKKQDQVKVTIAFPHFVDTGLVEGVTVKLPSLFPLLKPEWVVEQIITATREERSEVILPRATNYVILYMFIMPCKAFRVFCRWLGNDLMKTFRQTRTHNLGTSSK